MKTQRILVVDDEIKITQVIKSYLEKEGYEVFEAATCMAAESLLNEGKIDLMILDLMLPDMSGEVFCQQIRKTSQMPILMLTAKVEEVHILNGFDIGADDYMTKPFSVKQLVARVKALLRRANPEGSQGGTLLTYNQGDLTIAPEKHEIRKRGEVVNLTPNEYKILMTLATYPNKVFTREELITVALGDDFEGYDRTVDTHVKNIRQKIETDLKRFEYIITVHGVGYRFGGELCTV